MKKRFKSTLALILAMTMVLGGTMNVHAYNDDGTVKHPNEGGGEEVSGDFGGIGGGSDSGSSNSGGSSDSGSSNGGGSSYSDGGSSDSGSYDAGSSDSSSSASAGTASAPTGLARKGNTVSIPGYETFRQINKPADGRVSIYHCGIEQYTAQLKDADGNAVSYKSAGMYKNEATGKWYLNITTDADGCTVGTYKGSVNYLAKLGMSGATVNEKLVVEVTAE